MIELLQFAPAMGLMNASPFCMKVEVFLRLGGLDYRCVTEDLPMRAPKGKLPALRDGDVVVADSSAIIEHLQRHYGERMPLALRGADRGQALALRRMFEEHTYFGALWLRWIDDSGWRVTMPEIFGAMPWPLRPLVPALVRRKMRRDLQGQGMGRHGRDEICARLVLDLGAAADILGAQAYFGGDEPAAVDATAYAFLANLLWAPIDNPVREQGLKLAPLVAYCERMESLVGR